MLNIVNERPLTIDERKSILLRSINAVPFFNFIPFEVVSELIKRKQYKGTLYINLDFYLTEIRGNFDKVVQDTGTEWDVNIYMAESGKSVYGYNKGQPLPTPFIMTVARFDVLDVNKLFDDRQREFIPFKIPRGEEIISQIVNVDPKKDLAADAMILLCGFNTIQYPYLTSDETALINRSFNNETVFQTFRFTVDHDGQKMYNLTNDSTPRLILGFGIVNDKEDAANFSISDMSIFDSTRQLKLTNQQIPVEFLGPRIPEVLDTHIYYLPIEHYFMPFGNLRFLINNVKQGAGDGYEFVMLTRTV
jgi:hypothetical protein